MLRFINQKETTYEVSNYKMFAKLDIKESACIETLATE